MKLSFAPFLLIPFLLFACSGDGDERSLLPDQSNDNNSDNSSNRPTGDMSRCDNKGDCWGGCWFCATHGPCKPAYSACLGDGTCKALKDCLDNCDGASDWQGCSSNCYNAYPGGRQLYDAYLDCMYCEACVSDCAFVGHVCGGAVGCDEGPTNEIRTDNLVWRRANITHYTSYPEPGSEECINYSGCLYAGYFSCWPTTQKPESWVQANNIVAVHSKDWQQYSGKLLRIRQGAQQIDAWVYDMCSDNDCNNCCTRNSPTGFLLDLESYTYQRFGGSPTEGEFACLNCD
ncbi:MAG: hypothetical protein M0R76_11515 [Proteobacteria bacterium]|nr:hypothetical protein [Pseudomonadota bacterium]